MSDTVAIPGVEVTAYVEAVRSALADLPADEVDDLTQGMEADLAEVLGEGAGGLTERLGTPVAYAAELRTAAGLPDALPPAKAGRDWGGQLASWRVSGSAWADRHPSLVDAGRQLRPIWWLVRGVVVGDLARRWVFQSPALWVVAVAVVVSLWLGARQARAGRGERWVTRSMNGVAVLAAPLLLSFATLLVWPFSYWEIQSSSTVEVSSDDGLWLAGQQVNAIYAYDRAGHRLDDVRLFDDTGRPLDLWNLAETRPTWVDAAGVRWRNVFPATTDVGTGWIVTDPDTWHPPVEINPLLRQLNQTELDRSDGLNQVAADPPAPATPTPTGTLTR